MDCAGKSRRRPLCIGSCKSILTPLAGMMFLVNSSFNRRNRIFFYTNRPGNLLNFRPVRVGAYYFPNIFSKRRKV